MSKASLITNDYYDVSPMLSERQFLIVFYETMWSRYQLDLKTNCGAQIWPSKLYFWTCIYVHWRCKLYAGFHLVLFNKGHVVTTLVAIFVLNEHGEPGLNLQLISKELIWESNNKI